MSTLAPPTAAKKAPPGPSSQLRALGERSGAAVGDCYARAARAVLERLEQIEDLNAERRHEARLRAASTRRETPTVDPTPALPTTK